MRSVVFILICVLWPTSAEDSTSTPLILTPYLKGNDATKAREISRVTPDLGNVESYSGYFTVNKNATCGNNMFFWFFPAVKDWKSAPVILWLQGGPGSSSLYGLFKLNGPFNSLPEGLVPRNTSWNKFANVLYIDNPVGSGFSYTTNKCYPKTLTIVSEELHSALEQFFKLFPELLPNSFFLTGQSFAGHYIPSLGALIDKRNSQKYTHINMKGIVMGNPLIKMECHDYASFLYQVGIIDEKLRNEMYESQRKLKSHMKNKNYVGAFEVWNDIILNDLIKARTGHLGMFSILNEPEDPSTYSTFLNKTEIRKQLHVGSQEFVSFSQDVYDTLNATMPQSFTPDIQKLLNTKKYIVAIYSGNLDITCMYTAAECVMRGLKWPGQHEYLNATRNIWYLNDQVVGWFKTADNLLLDIVVKDAQHAAIYSQPEVTYRMMESIASSKPGENPLKALQTSASSK